MLITEHSENAKMKVRPEERVENFLLCGVCVCVLGNAAYFTASIKGGFGQIVGKGSRDGSADGGWGVEGVTNLFCSCVRIPSILFFT